VEAWGGPHVALLPGVEHAEQVVGVAAVEEEALPEPDEEVLQRRVARLAPHLVPVERLGESPAGVDTRGGAQSGGGLLVVPAAAEGAVGGECALHALEEHDVVRAGAARAAERECAGSNLTPCRCQMR
jgi:hypothetical protein